MLNQHFERIFILNLPYKPDRRERLQRHLSQLGLADQQEITWLRAYSGDMMPAPAWWNAGNGAWGCLLSHARVVQEAIMDKLANFLVLEDDAIFQANSQDMLNALMNQIPSDWDQLYLGGQHLKEPQDVEGKPFVLRAWNVNRTHAFALQKQIFTKYHQHIWHAPDYISKSGGWHIDHQLGLAHERGDWSVYAPSWWLAGQDSDWSNISGKQNPCLWWHPSRYSSKLPFIHVPTSEGMLSGARRDSLHAGNNLKPETAEDVGLDEASKSEAKLNDWLKMIAREALDMQKLPCWQHQDIPVDLVRKLWPTEVLSLQEANIPALMNYVGRL